MASLHRAKSDAGAMTVGRYEALHSLMLLATAYWVAKVICDMLMNVQGDDCSTKIDIQQCNVNAESGSPLLFGKTNNSACIALS